MLDFWYRDDFYFVDDHSKLVVHLRSVLMAGVTSVSMDTLLLELFERIRWTGIRPEANAKFFEQKKKFNKNVEVNNCLLGLKIEHRSKSSHWH